MKKFIFKHNTTQHNTTQHNTTQHNTTQHNTTQHGVFKPKIPLLNSLMLIFLMATNNVSSLVGQDISVCDNGGFEQGFTYYTGDTARFQYGSNICAPYISDGVPTVYGPVPMPSFRIFEIVSGGNDDVTGYNKVRFGQNALLINNRFGESSPICKKNYRINRITKQFLVTEANRNFTIWYSVALENPEGHMDQQPFFSIKCDLAPSDDLCYDGISYRANSIYPSGTCFYDGISKIKASNWACHRIRIPSNQIGNISTLEIMAADCGQGGHFGYVYIDGICEPCDGSSYGSGTIGFKPPKVPKMEISCNGDTITVKGTYTTPTIDGGYTILDNFTVPGFTVYAKTIDQVNKTFSFKITKANFLTITCRDVIAYLNFKNAAGDFLHAVPTNAEYICLSDFVDPMISAVVGGCNRNHPTNNVFSDDYYYVQFTVSNASNLNWEAQRWLDDPYPNESGKHTIKAGFGNGTYNLGPFLIQEGEWTLVLIHNNCPDTLHIVPPDYCSGCPELSKVKIHNIQCNPQTGTWSYDIYIPKLNPQIGEGFKIGNQSYFFNTNYYVPVGLVNQNCITIEVRYYTNLNNPIEDCIVVLDVCPPKPCINNGSDNCGLEVYFKKLNCQNTVNPTYTIDLDVKGAGYPCYKINGVMQGSFINPIGPYSSDVTVVVYSCGANQPFSCNCPNTLCYKVIKIRKPEDCAYRPSFGDSNPRSKEDDKNEIVIIPNPIPNDEFIISSPSIRSEFKIFNLVGKVIYSGSINESETRIKFQLPVGIYFLKYKKEVGNYKSIKFLKQ